MGWDSQPFRARISARRALRCELRVEDRLRRAQSICRAAGPEVANPVLVLKKGDREGL